MDTPQKPARARHQPQPQPSQMGGWIAVSVFIVGVGIWYLMWPYLH